VTIGTVSKALNEQGKLRPETRERVRAAAARLGFRPNDLANNLVRGRSFTVGLLSSDPWGYYSIPVMTGIEDALSDARISVFLCSARGDPERERQHLDALLAKRVDGIVVTGRRIDARPPIDLGGAGVPVVYAFAQSIEADALCLVPDDVQGGYIATEHLLQSGRRHLAHITGPAEQEAVRRRRAGMMQALAEHGLGSPEPWVGYGSWTESWGYAAANRLLDDGRCLDALFCGNDHIAHGAIDALRERGARLPDDIAIVGFDNRVRVATETRPALTTVDMELENLGREAGLRLLGLIDGRAQSGVIRFPCRLVIRQSAGVLAPSGNGRSRS
jgi:LacI family transcriptional regulator